MKRCTYINGRCPSSPNANVIFSVQSSLKISPAAV